MPTDAKADRQSNSVNWAAINLNSAESFAFFFFVTHTIMRDSVIMRTELSLSSSMASNSDVTVKPHTKKLLWYSGHGKFAVQESFVLTFGFEMRQSVSCVVLYFAEGDEIEQKFRQSRSAASLLLVVPVMVRIYRSALWSVGTVMRVLSNQECPSAMAHRTAIHSLCTAINFCSLWFRFQMH